MQQKYTRIFDIANQIHRECIIYNNVNSVWTSFIGTKITLSHNEFKKLKEVVIEINCLLFEIEYKINLLKHLVVTNDAYRDKFIEEQSDVFETHLMKSNILTHQIGELINQFKYKSTFEFENTEEHLKEEDIEKGTQWIQSFFKLCNKYLVFPHKVNTKEYIEALKEHWKDVENEDTIIISDILDNMLGGLSIDNIACNLRDWLIKYGDNRYSHIFAL